MENLVGYAKTDLMIPGAAGSGDPFTDLRRPIPPPRRGVPRSTPSVHSEICAVPAERLIIERELLGALPSLRASIGRVVTRKVDRLACVRFGSARYSVPVRLIGSAVRVHVEADRTLSITAGPREGEVVAEHALVPPGEASSAMITTVGRGRRHGGRYVRKPLRRRSSARSGRSRKRSSPAPPQPATPASGPSWSS